MKEDLYIRIVSTNKKVTVLERGIYRKIGDIILGVYLRINEDDGKTVHNTDRQYLSG